MRIVYLCHLSNAMVRSYLHLKSYKIRDFILSLMGRNSKTEYVDFAIWNTDMATEFEKLREHEFHIVAPHFGMKKNIEHFIVNGVSYHFFKCNKGLVYTFLDKIFHLEERNNFAENRKRISSIIGEINPEIVIMCGAENPYYSIGVLDVKDCPVYVILQTLLNSQKRIEAGVGNSYRRRVEKDIFCHAGYFCVSDEMSIATIKKINPLAKIMPAGFPTHRPIVKIPSQKDYDYVFFAKTIAVYKGIEDVLKALAIVKQNKPEVRLNIIGGISDDYQLHLNGMIEELGLEDNVNFAGFYPCIEDTYKNVVKATVVVVPGITAALNCTVRESMLMGMPTVVYETTATPAINKEKKCLFVAKMGNIEDLSEQMLLALDYSELRINIAANGKEYAVKNFSNEAIVNRLLGNVKEILFSFNGK